MPGLVELGRIVRFDVPGVGESPPPSEPYSFEELGEAAMQLVEPRGAGSLIVVGHAWGARAAQVIARDHAPDAVVIGSGGGKYPPLADAADMRTATTSVGDDEGDIEAWNERFERAYCAPGFGIRDPERAEWLFRLARTTPSDRAVVIGAMDRSPVETYWGRFDRPTLLLYGADDPGRTSGERRGPAAAAAEVDAGLHRRGRPLRDQRAGGALRRRGAPVGRRARPLTLFEGCSAVGDRLSRLPCCAGVCGSAIGS